MADLNDTLSKLSNLSKIIPDIDLLHTPEESYIYNYVPKVPQVEISEESTFAYQMQQQTNQILEKSNEQIKLLSEQNERLESNYKKLEELYNLKDNELTEAKSEAKKAKGYNAVMMIITIISMLVAIAAWLLPDILKSC